jgi:hypothetical protein
LAIRERILTLRELKEKRRRQRPIDRVRDGIGRAEEKSHGVGGISADGDSDVKPGQGEKKDADSDDGVGSDGEDAVGKAELDLEAMSLVPVPKGYDGHYTITTASHLLPPESPPFPSLLALHSQHANEEFPFNFGLRLRKSDPSDPRYHDTIYFHCLASDKCRASRIHTAVSYDTDRSGTRSGTSYTESGIISYDCTPIEPTKPKSVYRGTKAGIPIIEYKRPFVDYVVQHLEECHWNMLVQFGFAKHALKSRKFEGLSLEAGGLSDDEDD